MNAIPTKEIKEFKAFANNSKKKNKSNQPRDQFGVKRKNLVGHRSKGHGPAGFSMQKSILYQTNAKLASDSKRKKRRFHDESSRQGTSQLIMNIAIENFEQNNSNLDQAEFIIPVDPNERLLLEQLKKQMAQDETGEINLNENSANSKHIQVNQKSLNPSEFSVSPIKSKTIYEQKQNGNKKPQNAERPKSTQRIEEQDNRAKSDFDSNNYKSALKKQAVTPIAMRSINTTEKDKTISQQSEDMTPFPGVQGSKLMQPRGLNNFILMSTETPKELQNKNLIKKERSSPSFKNIAGRLINTNEAPSPNKVILSFQKSSQPENDYFGGRLKSAIIPSVYTQSSLSKFAPYASNEDNWIRISDLNDSKPTPQPDSPVQNKRETLKPNIVGFKGKPLGKFPTQTAKNFAFGALRPLKKIEVPTKTVSPNLSQFDRVSTHLLVKIPDDVSQKRTVVHEPGHDVTNSEQSVYLDKKESIAKQSSFEYQAQQNLFLNPSIVNSTQFKQEQGSHHDSIESSMEDFEEQKTFTLKASQLSSRDSDKILLPIQQETKILSRYDFKEQRKNSFNNQRISVGLNEDIINSMEQPNKFSDRRKTQNSVTSIEDQKPIKPKANQKESTKTTLTQYKTEVVVSRVISEKDIGDQLGKRGDFEEQKKMKFDGMKLNDYSARGGSTQKFGSSQANSVTDQQSPFALCFSPPKMEAGTHQYFDDLIQPKEQPSPLRNVSYSQYTNEDEFYLHPTQNQEPTIENTLKIRALQTSTRPVALKKEKQMQVLQTNGRITVSQAKRQSIGGVESKEDLNSVGMQTMTEPEYDAMHQGVGTQDFHDLSSDTLFENQSKEDHLSQKDQGPLQVRQILCKLGSSIEADLEKLSKSQNKVQSSKNHLKELAMLVAQGKFNPQISCLREELVLDPEAFTLIAQSYLKKPRLIVKDPVGPNKILHVHDDGTQKDHDMLKKIMSESMCISGDNINKLIKQNPQRWANKKKGSMQRVETGESAREMNISIEKFIGFGKNLNNELKVNEISKQTLNNSLQDYLLDPQSDPNLEGRNVRYLTSYIDGTKRQDDVQTELHPIEDRSSIIPASSNSSIFHNFPNAPINIFASNNFSTDDNALMLEQMYLNVNRPSTGIVISNLAEQKENVKQLYQTSYNSNTKLSQYLKKPSEPQIQSSDQRDQTWLRNRDYQNYEAYENSQVQLQSTYKSDQILKSETIVFPKNAKTPKKKKQKNSGQITLEKSIKHIFETQNDPSTERRMSNIDEAQTTAFNQNTFTEEIKQKTTSSMKSKQEQKEIATKKSRKPNSKRKSDSTPKGHFTTFQNDLVRKSVDTEEQLLDTQVKNSLDSENLHYQSVMQSKDLNSKLVINIKQQQKKPSEQTQLQNIQKSKTGMIANISKSFNSVMNFKSNQMLRKIKQNSGQEYQNTETLHPKDSKTVKIRHSRLSHNSENDYIQSTLLKGQYSSNQSSLNAKPLNQTLHYQTSINLLNNPIQIINVKTQFPNETDQRESVFIKSKTLDNQIKIEMGVPAKPYANIGSNTNMFSSQIRTQRVSSVVESQNNDQSQKLIETLESEHSFKILSQHEKEEEQEIQGLIVGSQFLAHPSIVKLTPEILEPQIIKRVQSQSYSRRPIQNNNKITQNHFKPMQHHNTAYLLQQQKLQNVFKQEKESLFMPGDTYYFGNKGKSSLDEQYEQFFKNLSRSKVSQPQFYNGARSNSLLSRCQVGDLAYWTDAWPKKQHYQSDALLQGQLPKVNQAFKDGNGLVSIDQSKWESSAISGRPLTQQNISRNRKGNAQQMQYKSDITSLTALTKDKAQTHLTEKIMETALSKAALALKNKIKQKSQSTFKFSKIKKGFAGTGKSDFELKHDGIIKY